MNRKEAMIWRYDPCRMARPGRTGGQIDPENNLYPNLLAIAERSWFGRRYQYFIERTMLPIDPDNENIRHLSILTRGVMA